MQDKIPPQNIEAEQALLGSVLHDNESISKVIPILIPEDFYKDAHKKIYETMRTMFVKNETIDLITLSDNLGELIEEIGGAYYLTQLMEAVIGGTRIASYVKIVKEKALLRQEIKIAENLLNQIYENENKTAIEFGNEFIGDMLKITTEKTDRGFLSISDILAHEINADNKVGFKTGFIDLDKMVKIIPGTFTVIASRPSMGKTAFAMNLAENMATEGNPCGIFSLEMSESQLAERFINRYDSKLDFTHQIARISELPIFIDTKPSQTTMELMSKILEAKNLYGIEIFFVDYLQLVKTENRNDPRYVQVTQVSETLKAIAKMANVSVIALAQLSRELEKRNNKRPILSDLRESGSIEQDGDLILFLYRESMYDKNYHDPGETEVIIAKYRNGATGISKLRFIAEETRFVEYASEAQEEPEYYKERKDLF